MSLTEENLDSSAPNCRFYTMSIRDEFKKVTLSSSGVKLVFSIKNGYAVNLKGVVYNYKSHCVDGPLSSFLH